MVNEIDVDGDGSIRFEFGVISAAFGPPSCDDELRGECRCMISGVDKNGDGVVCFLRTLWLKYTHKPLNNPPHLTT
ncbi:putative EF-hand domain-containing protein [Helianthus anomalus]